MEYTVIKDFYERGTLRFVKAGEKYACLVDRAQLLISRGYLAGPAEIKADVEEKPTKEAKPQKTAKTTSKRGVKKKA